jgi:hypothetical protein
LLLVVVARWEEQGNPDERGKAEIIDPAVSFSYESDRGWQRDMVSWRLLYADSRERRLAKRDTT